MERRAFLESVAGTLAGAAAACWAAPSGEAAPRGGTALVYDPFYKKHLTGAGHPERPERLDAIIKGLRDAKLDERLTPLVPRDATDTEILACHRQEYLDTVKRDVGEAARILSTGDTPLCPTSLDVARRAAGGVLAAVDAVVRGTARNAFCAVRPPGHHATPTRGMGFCLFNNAAIAARHAQKAHGVGKVLIVDWDVHHGNGTQEIFYADGSVFYFSTHQSPWYPGTGAAEERGTGPGEGTTLNKPLPAGAGRKEILGAFKDDLFPAMDRFKPELVLISAGFDSRAGDPLGRFQLADEDFADLTRIMLDMAKAHARGRLVSVLEGGYALDGLAAAVSAHVGTLAAV